ncbi:MAG: 50S ribosomal protein L29 [Candidatus Portnoybacteria bacterium]|nr:50S ribosomal protein L29 [Candidatus Portnoybacteria bacterium]
MDIKELKIKNEPELKTMLAEQREKLRQARFDLAEKKIKNVKIIPETRKTIARILTLLKK